MRNNKKITGLIMGISLLLVCVIVGVICFNKDATPEEIMTAIVENDSEAVISVGIWDNGKEEKYLFTKNGREDYIPYTYQIGSITKTFTGSLIAYEAQKGLLDIESGTPSYKQLMTHSSGLSDQWEQELEKNPQITFTQEDLQTILSSCTIADSPFEYSNFGTALAGGYAGEIYAKENNLSDFTYETAMNHFIKNEMLLTNTKVGGKGDFESNYPWKEFDQAMAAGAITSNLDDMLSYGLMYLKASDESYLKLASSPLMAIDDDYDIGFFWLIDKKTGIVWHNGELAMDGENGKEVGYQTFIGFKPGENRLVVILSNSICNDKNETALTDILGYLLLQ